LDEPLQFRRHLRSGGKLASGHDIDDRDQGQPDDRIQAGAEQRRAISDLR